MTSADPVRPAAARGEPLELVDLGGGRWRDPSTGLVVTAAPTGTLHRVFQAKFSALNPPIPTGERVTWSRWDVLDHVTLYGAETDVAAVVEVLAYSKPAMLNLSAIFPDVAPGADPVDADWRALGHMARGQIARAWRVAREMTTLQLLGGTGWFVDVGHAETIAALRASVGSWSPDPNLVRDPLQVDTSLLTSGRREVTTSVAAWLRGRVLADGSEPSGVRFTSKHGQNLICWAVWVALLGETGQQEVPELVGRVATAGQPTPLLENTPALLTASALLGVRVH